MSLLAIKIYNYYNTLFKVEYLFEGRMILKFVNSKFNLFKMCYELLIN